MNREGLLQLIVPGTDLDVVEAYCSYAERATDTAFGLEDEICVVDVETTGYDPGRDHLIEVAGAIMRGPEVLDRFETLVDPLVPISTEITRLTGIDDALVAGAPCAESAVSSLLAFAAGRPLLAHNASFDRSFLEAVAGRGSCGAPWLDSLIFARIGLPRLRSHRLADLADAFAPDLQGTAHRAAADVAALCRVWRVALVGIAELDPGLLLRLTSLAPDVDWPERRVLAQVAGSLPAAHHDLKELRRRRVAADRAEALSDADEIACACPSPDDVCAQFTPDGLAGRMYENYEQRAEQVEMARAVLDAFQTSTHCAIEAGTGVGKSMAYLVPSALYALENNVGVGVATKTNALMDQIVYHELPRLNEALGGELRYAALKGYDHYLCLRKLERFAMELDAKADVDLVASVAMLLAWTSQSSWGDLDAVNLHWRRDLRTAVQASQGDCTFKRCRFFPHICYLHGIRRRAASSHIVVTNHALLFRDVIAQGGILPPIRHWIIDEAHAAESEARKQLTLGASHFELSVVLSGLHGGRGGLLETLRRKLRSDESASDTMALLAKMQEAVQRAKTLADSLFDFVKDLAPLAADSDYDAAELWVNPEVRETGPWGVVSSTGRSLARRLETVIGHGRELMTRVEAHGADLADQRADLAGLLTRLADQLDGLVAVVDGEDDALVYSAQLDRRRNVDAERLVAARLDVGEVLTEDLYPRVHSVIFTSATLAAGDSFDHFARGVGLDRLVTDGWRSLKLTSSYDFERQMAVFVPLGLSEPNSPRYLADLEKLLESVHLAMGGSVLTLFTNRRDMERLHAILEPRLRSAGLDVIMQRRGTSAKRLRDEFIADERLSLFALKSFWEGFDAPGDTLRCVVVPKLPFGRPTDPLSRERECREGKVAWRRYTLPEAVIELKQAAGRLIRSTTDTGSLVIADARVTTKGYGRDFLAALPVADVERLPFEAIPAAIEARFSR
ncbi:MAG TPA: helicase C-terminal domain-containing protein [Coriobacteriia bacterium]|nr:helicase C-terminal domain-containing protein [Coriobacteriia bacterium]